MRPSWIAPLTAAIVAVAVSSIIFSIINGLHTEQKTIEVISKDRIMTYNPDSGSNIENFVYAKDDVYVVKDSLLQGHFRALTTYSQIPEHPSTCDVTVVGYRIGLLSLKQNIIRANCT